MSGGEIRVRRAVGAERLEERNVGVALPPDLGQRVRRHAAEGGAEDTREGNVEQGIVDDREERDGEQDLRALEEVFLLRQGDRNPVQRECADERRELPPQTAGENGDVARAERRFAVRVRLLIEQAPDLPRHVERFPRGEVVAHVFLCRGTFGVGVARGVSLEERFRFGVAHSPRAQHLCGRG